jgi:hypothetical protein
VSLTSAEEVSGDKNTLVEFFERFESRDSLLLMVKMSVV